MQTKAALDALSKQHTAEEDGDAMMDEDIPEKKTEENLIVLKSHHQAYESRIFSSTIDSLIYRSVSFKQDEEVPVLNADEGKMFQSPVTKQDILGDLVIPNGAAIRREGDLQDSPLSSSSPVKSGKRKRNSTTAGPDGKRRKSSRKNSERK